MRRTISQPLLSRASRHLRFFWLMKLSMEKFHRKTAALSRFSPPGQTIGKRFDPEQTDVHALSGKRHIDGARSTHESDGAEDGSELDATRGKSRGRRPSKWEQLWFQPSEGVQVRPRSQALAHPSRCSPDGARGRGCSARCEETWAAPRQDQEAASQTT